MLVKAGPIEGEKGGTCSRQGRDEECIQNISRNILTGWDDHLTRPRRIWEDTIKMDLKEIGDLGMVWSQLIQDMIQW